MTHLLSFDVEEYFQVQAAGIAPDAWPCYQKRLELSIDKILELLDFHRASATFFVLGWVAVHEPKVVRAIVHAGHEIASHGMNHQMLTTMKAEEFRADLRESKQRLEDIAGQAVVGYRAPTFSITRQTLWALDVLVEEGFRYDSSIFPVYHDRYGIPNAPRWIHQASGPSGSNIVEIPPLTWRAMGVNWPVGGGGYMRMFPVGLVKKGLKQAEKSDQPGMIYLHPWELDPDQPELPIKGIRRRRHRIGLKSTEHKLTDLLKNFPFTSVQKASVLSWNNNHLY